MKKMGGALEKGGCKRELRVSFLKIKKAEDGKREKGGWSSEKVSMSIGSLGMVSGSKLVNHFKNVLLET